MGAFGGLKKCENTFCFLCTTAYTVGEKTYRGGTVFPKTYHKIKSRQTFIVTMDCVDESDVEVFIMTLSLVMYRIENGFQSKLSNLKH